MFDDFNVFDDTVDLEGTRISTNVLDLEGTLKRYGVDLGLDNKLGTGTPIHVIVSCPVALVSSGNAADLVVSLETSDNADLSSSTVLAQTAAIDEGAVATGDGAVLARFTLPQNVAMGKHLGVRYTVTTEDFTAGSVFAALYID
jgi:hypothetical protein